MNIYFTITFFYLKILILLLLIFLNQDNYRNVQTLYRMFKHDNNVVRSFNVQRIRYLKITTAVQLSELVSIDRRYLRSSLVII